MSGNRFFSKVASYVGVFGLYVALTIGASAQQNTFETKSKFTIKYQNEIQKFLDKDKMSPPKKQGIVFVGSSTFRLWKTLEADMAPLPVLNRGFGGSRTWEVTHYMDSIVLPYQPKVVVYFCGTNDAGAKHSGESIYLRFREFSTKLRQRLPNTHLIYLAMTLAPAREKYWVEMREGNRLIEQYCNASRNRTFVNSNPALHDAAGRPRIEFFVDDDLHLNSEGYRTLTGVLRPVVEQVWRDVNLGK